MRAFAALFSACWRYAEGRRHLLVIYILLFVAANIVLLLEPIVIGRLLNSIQSIQILPQPLETLGTLFVLMIGIQAVFWFLHGPARVMENVSAFHAKNAFADHLYSIVSSLPVQWHKDHHSGQTINRIRKSTNALNEFMSNGFQLIEMVMRLIGSVAALLLIFPIAGFIAITISGLAMAVVFLFDRVLLPQYEEINEREHHTASAMHDYVTNMFTVISLRLEELTRSELWKRLNCYFSLFQRNNRINETKWFLATMIIALMTVTVLAWYAISMVSTGGILLAGTVYMLYEYLQKIGTSFYTFAWKYSTTIQQYSDLRATRSILDAAPALQVSAHPLPRDWKSITIDHLSFAYEDEEHHRHHLDDVSLVLERGKRIAFVGESGSGKSTLMSLLRGLHTTQSGRVLCDGKVLPHGLRHLAKHVTLMPQEPEIFSNTIEYNISVDTDQSEREILHDIDLAQFKTVLDRLPRGLKTDIAEKGVNLSGGEKQRLALARGIFAARGSDILLLDEPTSSVDTVNELQIYQNIFREFADRCIVSSIHRLHLLRMFDYVVVLENGRIIEQGHPDSLLNAGSRLREIVERMEKAAKREATDASA